jgi:hypothetical protein
MQLTRALLVLLVLGGVAHAQADDDDDSSDSGDAPPAPTGAIRTGLYSDSDQTRVFRFLGLVDGTRGDWSLDASVGVDAITSASTDVRSSPLGNVDVITGASGRTSTSGGTMTDRRIQATTGVTWDDGDGHTARVDAVAANERDYHSAGGGVNGSFDILGRSTTLLGGLDLTENWISSVLDDTLHERSDAFGWSGGVSRALTPDDLLRVRYDGEYAHGYQASPYRNVRFGDWTTTTNAFHQIMFANTIGDADGLPENEPRTRVRHAVTTEWLHAFGDEVGIHAALRLAHDSWSVDSATASLDLRVVKERWRLEAGYRFYAQSAADFYLPKYTSDPSTYTYFTSDKDLGEVIGHLGSVSWTRVLKEPDDFEQPRLLLDLRLDLFRYRYVDYLLMPSRTSAFVQIGLTWEI